MTLFEIVRRLQANHPIESILVDDVLVAPGYCFLVQHDEKEYVLINDRDFQLAKAWLIMSLPHPRMVDRVLERLPIVRDRKLIEKVSAGVYLDATDYN